MDKITSTPELKVGDIVLARWAVGNMTQGSGWVDVRRADPTTLEEWTISNVWAYGYHVQVPGGGQIGIHDGQFLLKEVSK